MHDGMMTNGAALADVDRCARIGVQHCAFLDIGFIADLDGLIVTAKHGTKPDPGICTQCHIANHMGIRRDPIPFLFG